MTTSPASGALPRYAEWMHLGTHGQWSNGVPSWAKDHNKQMNDTVAARAVIDELAAALASREASPAPLTDDDLDDLSHSAIDELLGCGLERHTLLRYFKTIRNRAALASPQVAPEPTDEQIDAALEIWFAEASTEGSTFRSRFRAALVPLAAPAPVAPTPAQPSQWQPIETAPKDGTHILVYAFAPNEDGDKFHMFCAAFWSGDDGGFVPLYEDDFGLMGDDLVLAPTHWATLPSEPEGEATK